MVDNIRNILDEISEDMKGVSSTLAANHIFDVAEFDTKLSPIDADLFYRFLVQLL